MTDIKTWCICGALTAAALCCGADPEAVFRERTKALLPRTERFLDRGKCSWDILDASGQKLGVLHQERIGDGERRDGFNGPVEVALVVGTDGKIVGVLVGKNRETPRFLRRIVDAGFLKRWNGLTAKRAAAAEVDAVTGATYTSRAIAHGVKTLSGSLAGESALEK